MRVSKKFRKNRGKKPRKQTKRKQIKSKKVTRSYNYKKRTSHRTRKHNRFNHYGGDGIDDNDCPICYETLNGLKENEMFTCPNVRCSKKYHKACIYNHFRRQLGLGEDLTCPYCRQHIPHPEDLPTDDIDEDDEIFTQMLRQVIICYRIPSPNSTNDEIFTEANRIEITDISESDRQEIMNEIIRQITDFVTNHETGTNQDEDDDDLFLQNFLDYLAENDSRILFPELGYAVVMMSNNMRNAVGRHFQ